MNLASLAYQLEESFSPTVAQSLFKLERSFCGLGLDLCPRIEEEAGTDLGSSGQWRCWPGLLGHVQFWLLTVLPVVALLTSHSLCPPVPPSGSVWPL